MYEGGFGLILVSIIATILFLIVVLLIVTIYRRAYNASKYRKMDMQREIFQKKLINVIESGLDPRAMKELTARPKSIRWRSIEHVLMGLIEEEKYAGRATELFKALGFVAFYEKNLESNHVIKKASAIDKLGKMRSETSKEKLIPLLDDENPEIVGVAIRSLSKIGSTQGLRSILEAAPRLLAGARTTRKTLETSLINFGSRSLPTLIEYGEKYEDPAPRASLLEVLSNMKTAESLPFALANIDHADPEVRSKALKVVGAAGATLTEAEKETVISRLDDPVWFVRLQAAKAVGNLKLGKGEDALAKRLLDPNWQVRNAAATAIVMASEKAVDIFLGTLNSRDRYARESICEEIEKTGFAGTLIQNMDSKDKETYAKSREILRIMHFLHYTIPLAEYVKTGTNAGIRREIERILGMEPAA